MFLLVTQYVSGIIMPIIRRTRQSRQIAYGVQHWPCCNRLEMVFVGGGFTTRETIPKQVHTELPHLLQSVAARPVLYTVGDLSALSCSPDDGHNDARNMLGHQ
jgi:hypothetical protein